MHIEAMYMEPVMGEGQPGKVIDRAFYDVARRLTKEHSSILVVDSIQAALRARGSLSVIDYPGFEDADAPDMETYSKVGALLDEVFCVCDWTGVMCACDVLRCFKTRHDAYVSVVWGVLAALNVARQSMLVRYHCPCWPCKDTLRTRMSPACMATP